jgi:hypothetical protein
VKRRQFITLFAAGLAANALPAPPVDETAEKQEHLTTEQLAQKAIESVEKLSKEEKAKLRAELGRK